MFKSKYRKVLKEIDDEIKGYKLTICDYELLMNEHIIHSAEYKMYDAWIKRVKAKLEALELLKQNISSL